MAAFLVLYRGAEKSKSNVGRLIHQSEFSRWNREISNAVLDSGNSIDAGKKITLEEIEPLPDHKLVTNWLILEANNEDEAVELSRGAPLLNNGGSAEVFEIDMAG